MPILESPRFSMRHGDLGEIEKALSTVGHVVLEGVWALPFLERLHAGIAAKFGEDDAKFAGHFDEFPVPVIDSYLGCHKGFDDFGADRDGFDAAFFEELERSGLPALYRRLLAGDFVVSQFERVLRRVDPHFPLRFTGLHHDGQLGALSSRGLRTTREFTLWTPLQDCSTEDISRLLLIERGQPTKQFLDEAPNRTQIAGIPFHPIQLRPAQFRDSSVEKESLGDVHARYDELFAALRCYAPYVSFGGAVLFERDVWHGSYHRPGMTRPRYSLDFRAVGEYRVIPETARFTGRLFQLVAVPQPPAVVEAPRPSSRWPFRPFAKGGARSSAH